MTRPTDECSVCGHPLRPSRSKAADYPGTRRKHGSKCQLCFRNPQNLTDEQLAERERRRNEKNCVGCGIKLRPAGTLLEDFPGTRRMATLGKCTTCYDRNGDTGSARKFVEKSYERDLEQLFVPDITEDSKRAVRRLIEDRYEGDDWLLFATGLEGEDL